MPGQTGRLERLASSASLAKSCAHIFIPLMISGRRAARATSPDNMRALSASVAMNSFPLRTSAILTRALLIKGRLNQRQTETAILTHDAILLSEYRPTLKQQPSFRASHSG